MIRLALAAFTALSLLATGAARGHAQERASVTGWVLDVETGEPVAEILVRLQPPSRRSVTDADGRFHFSEVRRGTYVLSVDDPAFGAHTDMLEVPASGAVQLSVRLGPAVFELEPIEVEVLGREEIQRRAFGSPLYRITRPEIEESLGGGQSLGELLRQRIPGITFDLGSSFGRPGCVEFRRPTSFVAGCQPPLIVVDGVRITSSNHFLATTPLEYIESLTVLSAAQAGTLYGLGSLNGVIEVQTRLPGVDRTSAVAAAGPGGPGLGALAQRRGWNAAYDWSLEQRSHPWLRSWGGATLGMLGGLAVALTASGDCSPLNDLRWQECSGNTRLASAATFTLPVLGGALGANLGGRTGGSHGRMLLTTAAAVMPMFMGYFFATPQKDGVRFRSQELFGRIVVVAGVPIVATAADRVFRSGR